MKDRLREVPWATVALGLAAVAGSFWPSLRAILIDLPAGVNGFLPTRPLTGHLTHATATHLAGNLVLFLPLLAIEERGKGIVAALLEIAFLALAVALGVRLFHPEWTSYSGLSGVVYGLLALTCARGLRAETPTGLRSIFGAALVLLAAKTTLEALWGGWWIAGDSLERALGVRYLVGSHASGLLGGLSLAWIESRKAVSPRENPRPSPSNEASGAATFGPACEVRVEELDSSR